jgi:hypothetical protein
LIEKLHGHKIPHQDDAMKKRIISLTTVLFIILLCLPYLLIPNTLRVSEATRVNIKSTSAFRTLLNNNDWIKWWPSKEVRKGDSSWPYAGFTFTTGEHFYNAIAIGIQKGKIKRGSRLNIIPLGIDSIFLVWEYRFPASLNPFIRMKEYKESVASKKAMRDILQSMQVFLNSPENIYGINIHVELAKDTTLISTKFRTAGYPTTAEIYEHIKELRLYAQKNQAKENNYPMLHIDSMDDHYESMVALSLNKALKNSGNFEFKRFVPWKVLTAEVKGGYGTIRQAHIQFNLFIQDYSLLQMANSFESLVTDRSLEGDSSKWITRFYTPIP